MKLLVDEDSQRKLLVRLLRAARHDVLTTYEAGLDARDDAEVLGAARANERAVLTRNFQDFRVLHLADPSHPGILVVHQDRDRSKNMTPERIAQAVTNLEASGWDIAGQIIALNAWDYPRPDPNAMPNA